MKIYNTLITQKIGFSVDNKVFLNREEAYKNALATARDYLSQTKRFGFTLEEDPDRGIVQVKAKDTTMMTVSLQEATLAAGSLQDTLTDLKKEACGRMASILKAYKEPYLNFLAAGEEGFENIPSIVEEVGFSNNWFRMPVDVVNFKGVRSGVDVITVEASDEDGSVEVSFESLALENMLYVIESAEEFVKEYPDGNPEDE